MANTYVLIASNTLGASAASVTFSSIPNTYTDLVLRVSARTDRAGSNWDDLKVVINSDTATNYSDTYLLGNGSISASSRDTSTAYMTGARCLTGATATSNTFGNIELYIPSYTASQNKPMSNFGVGEDNTTSAVMAITAGLWRNTATISTIVLSPLNATNFVSGSSFFLYGIKNS